MSHMVIFMTPTHLPTLATFSPRHIQRRQTITFIGYQLMTIEEEMVHNPLTMIEPKDETNGDGETGKFKAGEPSREVGVMRQRQDLELDAPEDRSPEAPGDEFLARQAHVTSVINRLLDCAPEILDRVLETALVSEKLSWHPAVSEDYQPCVELPLEEAVDRFFGWPSTIEPAKRQTLNQRAVPIFLKTTTIGLSGYFATKESRTFIRAPSAIQENRHHIRRLAIVVWIMHFDNGDQSSLHATTIGMESLKAQFPRLGVCVISLKFLNGSRSRPSVFRARLLTLRGKVGPRDFQPVKVLVVKLINALRERGPGSRNFIRFCNQMPTEGPPSLYHIGPLVEIQKAAPATGSGKLSDGVDVGHADAGWEVGEQLLKRAYRFVRKSEHPTR